MRIITECTVCHFRGHVAQSGFGCSNCIRGTMREIDIPDDLNPYVGAAERHKQVLQARRDRDAERERIVAMGTFWC